MPNESDIESTYRVLETLRTSFQDDGMSDEANVINEAHALVQEYGEEL